jgi:hypothetical protein
MRDKDLVAIRPQLPLDNSQATPIELFQNETLRPILKLQHPLLQAIFEAYILQRKSAFSTLNTLQKAAYIDHSIKNDIKFKNRLFGIIMGHFTLEEYHFFIENEQELSRRLTSLLVQRVQSVFA